MRTVGAAWWGQCRVRMLLLLGRYQQVLAELAVQLEQRPGDAQAWATLAHVQAQLGDLPGAVTSQKQRVALTPDEAAVWFNLGYLHEQAGELLAAEAAFRRAAELDPLLDRAWYGLALSLIGQQRLDEAVAALCRNTELQPMSPYGWYQLARVQADRNEPETAARIIQHLRQFEPRVAAQLVRETGLGQH